MFALGDCDEACSVPEALKITDVFEASVAEHASSSIEGMV